MANNMIQRSSRRVFLTSAMAACFLTGAPLQQAMAAPHVQSTQQAVTVKGIIVDPTGEPIIGATIRHRGTGTGTISDQDGNFSINAQRGEELEVSFLGYKTQIVKMSGQSVTVTMLEDSKALQEVVVVGFGTQKKVNLTGAVSVVDGDELAQRPVQSAAMALQGVVPGLQISSTSGTLDATPSINVRGTATIGEGSSGSPLILIDGMEGDLNTINSQDIQSISVLKDAAASSIYGSRAPFGVILITTKNGSKEGKVKVNYNNSFRFSSLIRGKHMMNSVDYASWMNDAKVNSGSSVFFDADRMARIKEYHEATPVSPGVRMTADGRKVYAISSQNGVTWDDGYGYGIDDVDWYDVVYKKSAFSMEHNASVSGGNERLSYYASLGYLDQDGFMNMGSDGYKRYNGTAKMNMELAKWIHMNYNMRFTRTNYHRPAGLTRGLYNDMARQGWPMLPLYDRNGYLYSSPSPALGLATGGTDTRERDIINHQLGLVLEPVANWITHIDFNYKIENTVRHWDSHRTYNHNVAGEPVIYNQGSNVHEDEAKDNYLNFQAYTEYSLTLAEKHNFHVMAGFQTEQLKRLNFGLQRDGILDPSKPEVDLTNGLSYSGESIVPSVNGSRNQWQTAGFFGRINYNYDEKYLFEANLRYDGTSRFRTDNMWKLFPSVSLGWNMARENFWKPLADKVNTLKIRASYGSLGNQNIDNWYQTYQTIAYNSVAGNWLQKGARPNITSAPGLVSALLTWEKVESYDIGLDFGAFNNRLTGTFDYYVRNTLDMVGNAPELPALLGTNVPVTNNTDLRTTGWELQVGWRDVLKNGLAYGVTFNISDARTKITRYPNNPTNSINTYIKGQYLNEIWGFETIGIAKSDEEMNTHLANADQSSLGSNWAAGDIMYRDLNGDKKITRGAQTLDDHGDLKIIGNSTPRYLVGLNLNAAWKGFDINAFFQGILKRDWWIGGSWGGGLEYLFGTTNSWEWWSVGITDVHDYYRDANTWSVQNGYQQANQDAWLPRVQFSDKNEQAQTRYLMNGAYIRLKNIQLGYTIPRSITQHWGVSNLRVFVSAENLFTITDMPNQFDPELMSNDVNQNNGYPLQKTFAFGLNVSF